MGVGRSTGASCTVKADQERLGLDRCELRDSTYEQPLAPFLLFLWPATCSSGSVMPPGCWRLPLLSLYLSFSQNLRSTWPFTNETRPCGCSMALQLYHVQDRTLISSRTDFLPYSLSSWCHRFGFFPPKGCSFFFISVSISQKDLPNLFFWPSSLIILICILSYQKGSLSSLSWAVTGLFWILLLYLQSILSTVARMKLIKCSLNPVFGTELFAEDWAQATAQPYLTAVSICPAPGLPLWPIVLPLIPCWDVFLPSFT